ncbi:MAG: hypothetical protein WC419_03480 [Candidatus Omnitrophota bacterium]
MLVGEVWAARSSSGLTSVGPDSTGSPSPLKSLSAATFTLPQDLGYIQESTEVSNSGKTVIHIQDAHCNYAAQRSIAGILDYLSTEYGIYAVNCEGGAESYDLSPFTAIPEKDIREKTADFFVKEGVVSAAEFFAVNNPEKIKLWGVEDPDLYLKNLKIYRDSLVHKDEVNKYIKSIGYILNNLKRHIYSSELLKFDNYYTRYKENKISFKEYLLYLIGMAPKRMIDIKSFSNIYLLSQTLADEDKINFKLANNERDEVVDKLKKSLSRNELEELMVMVGKLKSERISQADFYAYLVKKAKSAKLDISVYPELQKYIIYISLYSAIDRTKIAKEIDTLEYRIKTSLYENDTQRELGVLSKNLAIMKNMFNISLTRDDYTYYKDHRETFAMANYISFIDKKAPLYKISATLDKNIGSLDEYRGLMDQFYECSLERDKAFIKNIKFTDHDRPNSIIITGGFHTENLRELFKNENVSYVSIMPKFKNEKGYVSPYMKRLAGQRTALENVINTAIPAVLNLQVVEILSEKLAILVEGKLRVELFNFILVPMVAALIRGQSFILKVGRGIPVNNAKTEEEKFITFPRGEGADIIGSPVVSSSLGPNQRENAQVTKGASGVLEFELVTRQPQTAETQPPLPVVREVSAIKEPAPVTKPASEAIVDEDSGEYIYGKAVDPATGILKELRQGKPTRLISPVLSMEERDPTNSNNLLAQRLLNRQGHEVSAKCYMADKERWVGELKELLEKELPLFAGQVSRESASRMAIRIIEDDKNARQEIKDFVNNFLKERYPEQEADKILAGIRFIQVDISNIQRLSPSLDLFVDLGMMECDRYMTGEYGDREMPQELQNKLLMLLRLSLINREFTLTANVPLILKDIFEGLILRIRPVNWNTIDQWKKANRHLLQSV